MLEKLLPPWQRTDSAGPTSGLHVEFSVQPLVKSVVEPSGPRAPQKPLRPVAALVCAVQAQGSLAVVDARLWPLSRRASAGVGPIVEPA